MTRNEIDTVLNEFEQYRDARPEARAGFAICLADAYISASEVQYAWALYYHGWNRCVHAFLPRSTVAQHNLQG